MIDLLVAGGGPAGLATAIYGAKAGLEVVVVEKRCGAVDKACGEGMLPHTLRHLERLGVSAQGMPLRGIAYVDGADRIDAAFRTGPGRGVRRTVLHAAMLRAADEAGVRRVHGRIERVAQDPYSVCAGGFRARYLAAADGLHSPIRSALGLARPCTDHRRWGIRRHVQIAPWSDRVEVHWAAGSEAYVTPVAPDCVGIAVLSSTRGGFDRQLADFPELTDRFAGVAHGPDRAAGPLRQGARRRSAGRVLLVGDAAGYIDALTGEGMGLAFGGAQALVNCVVAESPGDYDRQWRTLTRRYRLLTAGLVRAGSMPMIRSRIVPAARAMPAVFNGIVNQLAA
ncbi:NAD(P)/FAD-dependent oxidoreductase [Mycobacterium sp. pW049]|uniref:NAD(P)/FAD-dependent oxidoreductase n=1 Tax=[Mycobacterium] bulgaricum TaxID=3238985 RepID=UPI00351BE272